MLASSVPVTPLRVNRSPTWAWHAERSAHPPTSAKRGGLGHELVVQKATANNLRGIDVCFRLGALNVVTGVSGAGKSTLVDHVLARALRQRLHQASVTRGSRGNAYDNTAIIARVAKLRAERATMLGYTNHAAYVLEDATALTPAAVNERLAQLAPAAISNAVNNSQVVRLLGRHRQVFTQWYARRRCANWFERPTIFQRRVRLHVPHIDVRSASAEEK